MPRTIDTIDDLAARTLARMEHEERQARLAEDLQEEALALWAVEHAFRCGPPSEDLP